MPINQSGDLLLNGKPFMLWRDKTGARSWQRERVPDSLTTQRRLWKSINQNEVYGGLPDELDHPEIWSDWSGGYGRYLEVKGPSGQNNQFHVGYNVDTRFPGQAYLCQAPQLLPANAEVDYFLDIPIPGNSVAGAGQVLLIGALGLKAVAPTAANTFDTLANGSINSYQRRGAVFGSYVYVPHGNGDGFVQVDFGLVTESLFTTLPTDWFTVANGRAWRGFGHANVQSCPQGSDPTVTSNWAGTISIGNGQLRSLDAQAFEDNLYIGMPDGLYQGDQTGTFNNVLTDVGVNVNPDNIRDVAVHNGGLVVAEGQHVWWYKPSSGANSTLRQIWPTLDIRPIASLPGSPGPGTSLKGNITCLAGFGRWLYAGVFTGSRSMVYCGYDASGGILPYVWHPMQLFNETCKISRIHVDAITATSGGVSVPRRIWVATEASFGAQSGCTAPVYFWPIPRNDEQPFGDPSFSANYAPAGYIETSVTDSDVPTIWKAWRKLEVWNEGIGGSAAAASTNITIAAFLDATMSSTFDSDVYTRRPKDFHYFKNTNNDAIGQSAALGIQFNSGDPGCTPLLRSMVGHNLFRPPIAEQITAKVRIGDRIVDRQQNEMRPGAVMLDELETMSKASNPFPLTDLVGRTFPVVVLPGVDEQEAYQVGSDDPEVVATVKIGVIDASWNAGPTVPLHPDGD